jgi:integrase
MEARQKGKTLRFQRKPDRKKLTKRTVEALVSPPTAPDGRPGRFWVYDAMTPRLAICCWSTGKRVWYWVGRNVNGRMLRQKLGAYPEVPPELARKKAARVSVQVSDGTDPRQAKRNARAKELILGELFAAYLEGHARPHKRTWQRDEAQFALHFGALAARGLSTMTTAEVAAIHRRIGAERGQVSANRALALLSKMFAFAPGVGYSGPNPAKGVRRFRETARERFLGETELGRFWAGLAGEPQWAQDFFTLLLLTGARRGNVAAMRFEHIDFDAAVWRVPAPESKNASALHVVLTGPALEILRRRLAASSDNPWVFPSKKKSGAHLRDPKKSWVRILDRAGLSDVHMHDLRRTLGSWQAAAGASLPIIGKALGHRSPASTAVYARLDLEPVRASVNAATAAMMAAAEPSNSPRTPDATCGQLPPAATASLEGY